MKDLKKLVTTFECTMIRLVWAATRIGNKCSNRNHIRNMIQFCLNLFNTGGRDNTMNENVAVVVNSLVTDVRRSVGVGEDITKKDFFWCRKSQLRQSERRWWRRRCHVELIDVKNNWGGGQKIIEWLFFCKKFEEKVNQN